MYCYVMYCYVVIYNLIGGDWNMTFIFPYIGYVIIPIDFHIFQRGGSTTNQMGMLQHIFQDLGMRGFMGYDATNLFEINPHFGTKQVRTGNGMGLLVLGWGKPWVINWVVLQMTKT